MPGLRADAQISTPAAEGAPRENRLAIRSRRRAFGDGRARRRSPLPRSRKCRALIAYLAATARPQRREHLCELLWDVPDDPRGSLRWSLSKIRRVLGDALVAERRARLDRPARRSSSMPPSCSTRRSGSTRSRPRISSGWRDAATRPSASDLDLPRCPEFQGWLIAVREDVRQAQLAVLGELVRRLDDDPDRALPFARTRVACDPLDERARLDLLDVLAAAGRTDEAEQPAPPRRRRPEGRRNRGPRGAVPPASQARSRRSDRARPLVQRIQFCTAPDGTRIA